MFALPLSKVNLNGLELGISDTINVPKLLLLPSLNWNLFPFSKPWGLVVVTLDIPELTKLKAVAEEVFPTIKTYWSELILGSPAVFAIPIWLGVGTLVVLKYASVVIPEPVTCITRFSWEDVKFSFLSATPLALPNLAAPSAPPITVLSQCPNSVPDGENPEPGFVILYPDCIAPPLMVTFPKAPLQLFSST